MNKIMSLKFISQHITLIEDLCFFLKCGLIDIETAKEWVLYQIRLGNDDLIDFIWIHQDIHAVKEYIENLQKKYNENNNLNGVLKRRNKILVCWLSIEIQTYKDFLEIIESYYCDNEHPEDLAMFIPYMPKNDNYPPLSEATFKQRCNMYLKKN